MKRLIILIPFILFALDDRVVKIVDYNFKIDLPKIYSPFYKKAVIRGKNKKRKPVKKRKIIRYKYKLVSIMANIAKVRVIKYVNNSIFDIDYIFLKKGDYLNGCKVLKIGASYIKMRCNNTVKNLKLESIKIPCIKEIK